MVVIETTHDPSLSTAAVLADARSPWWLRELHDERAEILGCAVDRVDLEQAITVCEEFITTRTFGQHMAINVAKLMAMRDDPELRDSIEQCELITADGLPVVWASRLLSDPLPCRVAGIDLMHGLLARSAEKGYRVYILGAKREVLEKAVEQIEAQHKGINIVGYRDGYYEDAEEATVAEEIGATRPDILFVAMSSPRKEYFLARHRRTMGVPFVMGVGGSIDVVSGITRRAPKLLQRLGLEWLFRLAQEPRRLARRYFKTNTRFMLVLARQLIARSASAPVAPRLQAAPATDRAHGARSAGATVWLDGPAASLPLAAALEERIARRGRPTYLLDGEDLRHGLSSDLGLDDDERPENVRRLAHVARFIADSGAIVIVNPEGVDASDYETALRIHEERGVTFVKVVAEDRRAGSPVEGSTTQGRHDALALGRATGGAGGEWDDSLSSDGGLDPDERGLDDVAEQLLATLHGRGTVPGGVS